jgi:hypothetical protein
MKKCMELVETYRDNDRKNDSLFIDTIDVIFNLGFIINCLLFANGLSPTNIIIYIQFMSAATMKE